MITQLNRISIADTVIGKVSKKHNSTTEVTIMSRIKQYNWVALLVALVASFGFTATATAQTSVSPVQYSNSTFGSTVTDQSVAVSNGSTSSKVTVLADVKLSYKGTNRKQCQSLQKFWNTGHNANGKLYKFVDYNGKICRSAKSPTGWIKVSGGRSGRACGNPAAPMSKPPKAPKAKGKVRMVRNFVYTAMATAMATASITGSATAYCKTEYTSASSTVNAVGSATAMASASAKSSSKSSAVSQATANAVAVVSKDKTKVYASAKADAEVKVTGSASAYCAKASTPPPPPPPVICPYGSTPSQDGKSCVKNGSTTPPPPTSAPGPNPPPADNTSAKCYWESAGAYKGVSHNSGDPVAPSQMGANNTCPTGSTDGT